MDSKWPDTGNTVKYTWELSNTTGAPDGYERILMLVNGQYPGPTLEANWGDNIEVTLTNNLQSNGTGIHWHGFRQLGTNDEDGTGGVTECPIPPGGSRTYRFKASQYGTSWWHSHYSVQYSEGVSGPIVIHGPSTKNWDVDLGPLPFTDWFHTPVFTVNAATLHANAPPTADNMLVNGTMVSDQGGNYAVTTLQKGKTHLLRLMNNGINNWVNIALDGHPFTVIAADFNPIVPFSADSLTIAVGQRYDVVINANQTAGNYWLRVGTGGGACDGPNANAGNVRSIFRYEGADEKNPESEASAQLSTGCDDEKNLVPWVKTTVPQTTPKDMEVKFSNTVVDGANLVQWLIGDTPMHINLSSPSIQQISYNDGNFSKSENTYNIGQANKFQYWVIQQDPANLAAVPHPVHLHGHDFYVLAQESEKTWDGDISGLKMDNPPRRDTATLPVKGYLVLAFESDNPGLWLMHCHIPFHLSQGFGVQFVERAGDITGTLDKVNGWCEDWISWRGKYYPDGLSEGDVSV
ncbi:laccase, multicopper oxidase, benzenediol:oxygen oxidorectuctase [Didymosphaeria variabile]|uniref:Laccase, multicopper oxidase, benzenediol:oxygen oxidorectuctase n=1 Tax=Didymosphaeria variabile TaxID=1932322 RepID=A0A9W8XV90_9PLEO|nr:laccase, multicopper oxidase, benzenediol:oxygen oxidorectuctase [Didymosphaeria variabile]KAJ4360369.1 laccase, multicopper oxidase, benzenediol:oxygen oxidorectuctase [Didymosphaeria variabile]